MKFLPITLSVALLIFVTGTFQDVTALTLPMEMAQVPSVGNQPVSVVLFRTVNVVLRDKTSLSGTLTVFDLKKQIIEVSRDDVASSKPINLSQVREIQFIPPYMVGNCEEKKCLFPPIIRGPKITLSSIPLNALMVLNFKEEKATLDPITQENKIAINSILPEPDEILYVDKIQFESAGKMKITVRTIKSPIED